jgi:predicted Zn finger-like uncharacterized protein
MLLACPHCATIYDVSRSIIGANGRSLRCARCETVWFATQSQELLLGPRSAPQPGAADMQAPLDQPRAEPEQNPEVSAKEVSPVAASGFPASTVTEAGAASLSAQVEDIESAARRREQEAADRARRLRQQLGSPAIIAVLSLILAFLFAWRVPIVQVAPQMASFYAAIGMPVNLRHLEFRNLNTYNETHDGLSTLVIEGTIASIARVPVEVPRLRLALRNAARQEIVSWTAAPDQSTLAPGETLAFRSRLAAPPEQGHDVVVRFFTKLDTKEGRH